MTGFTLLRYIHKEYNANRTTINFQYGEIQLNLVKHNFKIDLNSDKFPTYLCFIFSFLIIPGFLLLITKSDLDNNSKCEYVKINERKRIYLTFFEKLYLNYLFNMILKNETKKLNKQIRIRTNENLHNDLKFINDELFDKKADKLING